MGRADAKKSNLVGVELLYQIIRYRGWEVQALECGFNNNLPATGDAQKQLASRIFEVGSVLRCKARIIGEDPQEYVGVEKDLHRPNASRKSAGRGASKSS